MRTIVIRVEEDAGRRPIHLFEQDGREDWLTSPTATAEVPDIAPPALPPPRSNEAGGDPIRSFLLEQASPSRDFARIGAYLHSLIAVGEVGDRWRALAAPGGGGVRVMLDMRAEKLAKLPWELLFDAPKWLGSDISNPLLRVTSAFPGAGAILPVRWPLRVLVVVGSEEEDRIVDAERELVNLADAFRRLSGLVYVEFLNQPSRHEVEEKYRELRPHIFHFIGHGSVEGDRGRLVLHDRSTGDNLPWSADLIDMDLAGWQPRLAILNACRTDSVEEQDGAWGIATVFQRLGVLAVVAMQADIRGDAAAAFTGELYRALARNEPLDVAVTYGRRAITAVTGGAEERDFALPSLTVSAPPENLLRMRFGVRDDQRDRVEYLKSKWAGFVDRTEERRRLWREVDPEPEEEPAPANGQAVADAIAIVGRSQVGKSELARWCVAACALHGGNAAYVDLDRGKRLGFKETLEIIGETLNDSPLYGEQNGRAFRRWTEEISRLSLADDSTVAPPPDALESAFTYFSNALQTAANERPLLIALDHIGHVQEPDWTLISRWLLEPIALHRLSPVRVIVVLAEGERSAALTGPFEDAMATPVELPTFTLAQFNPVAGEYLRHRFDVNLDTLDERLVAVGELFSFPEFSWIELKNLAALASSSASWKAFT